MSKIFVKVDGLLVEQDVDNEAMLLLTGKEAMFHRICFPDNAFLIAIMRKARDRNIQGPIKKDLILEVIKEFSTEAVNLGVIKEGEIPEVSFEKPQLLAITKGGSFSPDIKQN